MENCNYKRKLKPCINTYKEYSLIMIPDGYADVFGNIKPLYIVLCKRPNWKTEGLLVTKKIEDATKFDSNCKEMDDILTYVRELLETANVCITKVDGRIFGHKPTEVWSEEEVQGDFLDTRRVAAHSIKEII